MKYIFHTMAMMLILGSCATTTPLEVQVAPLGEENAEAQARYFYALPRSVIRVELSYRERHHVPGPYREYADKYLGIQEVIRQKSSDWQIMDVNFEVHSELDPGKFYRLQVQEGIFDRMSLDSFLEKGLILDGSARVDAGISTAALESGIQRDFVSYRDLGIESNFQERTETMYKTIVTDTSYVEVPVDRTITEQKSISKKAGEAADFLLELRTRRFELLTGEYESFPEGVAMEATLDKLDKLEASYLSLFTGKTLEKQGKVSWFIVPEEGTDLSEYRLAMFSDQLGFVPEELMEGKELKVRLTPLGITSQLKESRSPEGEGAYPVNNIIYRLPDVVRVEVIKGEEVLLERRLSVYQSGAMIADPL